ncbi:hypothetical protein FEZ35_05780 [Lactobacillus delbrueckii subsp. bulgaricus]|uniref:Uncharacterized protein n=1 Tax=Lactobacillus delbrueckii subsp. lactis TaxID=29397 RepID=A0A3G6K855_LACDL|nr:MAG: hypothetical protein DQL93_08590 [Lactobacillus delbrueckii subsp. lactis]MBD5835801.1 hypothetical protein [Lactobacillus delbrueckii]RXS44834.1 hypothetical protein EST31_01005 [Lactobacillus delbrueckii subsp. bulgaricus]AZA26186.1 MAG: hypothetical protein DF199_02950 [Lactobacillus delbrueckii subsp. lactis]MCS8614719.1 hypothetical protein [Lactobacillus delbrueckii subsp. lactis]
MPILKKSPLFGVLVNGGLFCTQLC